jgi:hypothetical protein
MGVESGRALLEDGDGSGVGAETIAGGDPRGLAGGGEGSSGVGGSWRSGMGMVGERRRIG